MFSQSHSDIWLIGRTLFPFEAIQFDFMSGLPTQSTVYTGIYMGSATNSSIGNENGELLMYTNGIAIANKLGELMENGDSLNTGAWADAVGDNGYPVAQGAFFIPAPDNTDQYYLFHMFIDLVGNGAPLTKFLYSLIDLSYNNGLGKIIEKNVPLLTGGYLLNYNQATAVRHANGRDWWIVVPNHMQPQYFRFLLTPDGIEGPWIQEIGFKQPTDNWWDYSFGQRLFSPDGSKFADYDFLNYTQVFNFDRCSGLLSNPILIEHDIDPVVNNGGSSIAFSPSGRFLYMSRTKNGYALFQYDMEADDILASEIIISHCINPPPFSCSFDNLILGADGKIYVDGADTLSFHCINFPDEKGIDCDFDFQGFNLISSNPNPWFPYFPNYRLGALAGSVCDSIVSGDENVIIGKPELLLSPNPASDYAGVSVNFPRHLFGQNVELVLLNPLGQIVEVRRYDRVVPQYRFDVTMLPPGLYSFALQLDGRVVTAVRFSIVR